MACRLDSQILWTMIYRADKVRHRPQLGLGVALVGAISID
jgi:hypothetical protein